MKKGFLSILLLSTVLCCTTACRSVTPINICHSLDFSNGTRYVENRLTGEKIKIDNPQNASHFRLLLQENGLKKEADQLFKDKSVIHQIFFCTRDSDNNSGWGLERADFIESTARLIRNLESPAERQTAAGKLLTLWFNGSELQVFHFYQQILAKFNKKVEYISTDPDHPLPPTEIREIKRSSSEAAANIDSLSRLFDENGIMTREMLLSPEGSGSGWQFYPAFRELQ